MKKLERGRFADLWAGGGGAPVRLTSSELALFIEGCALVGKKALSPREITRNELAVADRT
jgi:transposase